MTVRFARRSSRGLILGLSGLQVACIAAAASVALPSLFTAGGTGLLVTSFVWVTLLAVAIAPWAGQPAVETLPTAGHYALRHAAGQTSYRARPSKPRPAGTLALPGDCASLRFHQDATSGAVMVHDPHRQTLTAVTRVGYPAYVLLSPDEQARRVHGWGRALAGLAASGVCARVQVLETSLPDSGHGITGWWAEHGSTEASQWAVHQYDELMASMAPAASIHRTLIALSLDLRKSAQAIRASGRRGLTAAASVLGQEMTNFEASLRAAELKPDTWLDAGDLAGVLRGAYDPAATAQLETSGLGHDLTTAGPVAIEEHWDHVRHDTGHSAVLWISEWPRIDVPPHFLHSLVFAPGIRKTISITATPLSTRAAMRDIRKEKVAYLTDADQKARIGAIADLRDAHELEDVLDRERALVSGHADLRFTGLVTVTAASKPDLDKAISELQRAATHCGCETRRLFGQQARAFNAGALPLARKVD